MVRESQLGWHIAGLPFQATCTSYPYISTGILFLVGPLIYRTDYTRVLESCKSECFYCKISQSVFYIIQMSCKKSNSFYTIQRNPSLTLPTMAPIQVWMLCPFRTLQLVNNNTEQIDEWLGVMAVMLKTASAVYLPTYIVNSFSHRMTSLSETNTAGQGSSSKSIHHGSNHLTTTVKIVITLNGSCWPELAT